MILFFDRNTGTALPSALRLLRPLCPIEIHQEHFDQMAPDDEWLAVVGRWGWTVIGQDYSFHRRPAQLDAIRQHNAGVFYLWGANGTRWESARVFMKAFDAIATAADEAPRPFIFRVLRSGQLQSVRLR